MPQAASSAATWWVSPSGDDSNPGTATSRFRTVQKAISVLQTGDEIVLGDGWYEPGIINIQGKYGWLGSETVIRAENYRQAHILGRFFIKECSWIELRDLDLLCRFQNGQPTDNEPGIWFDHCHHIWAVGNQVRNYGGGGINCTWCDWIRIVSNTLSQNATHNPDAHSGISVYEPLDLENDPGGSAWGIVVSKNFSWGNYNNSSNMPNPTDGNGIIIDDLLYKQDTFPSGIPNGQLALAKSETNLHGRPKAPSNGYPRNTLVESNVCTSNGGRGISIYLSQSVYVKNNTLGDNNTWNNYQSNIDGEISVSGVRYSQFINNIFHGARYWSYGASYSNSPANQYQPRVDSYGNLWNYNLVFHATNTSRYYREPDHPWTFQQQGGGNYENVFSDPLFSANWVISPQSPAHGEGYHWQSPHIDEDILSTVRQNPPDLGAYEK